MLVQDIMTRAVLTVRPSTTLAEALRIARKRGIRHLPVLDDEGHLVGIVSDRDLKRATGMYDDVRMGAIMTSTVLRTAAPTFTVEATIDPGAAIRTLEARGYPVRDAQHAPV